MNVVIRNARLADGRILDIALQDGFIANGTQADLVILDAQSWHEALAFQPAKAMVFLRGRLISTSAYSSQLHL